MKLFVYILYLQSIESKFMQISQIIHKADGREDLSKAKTGEKNTFFYCC